MIPCEEEIQIRDMARQFAQERLKPFATDWDREHRFPAEAIREMADLGFLGMLVPEEWGGAQTGHLAYAMALRGDRRWRRRLLDHHERAQLGGLHADPQVWQRRAEGALPPSAGPGFDARRLRPDRAAGRFRRQLPEDPRPPRR
ncbi:acyl-CoA dehydrogenase [Pseudomonas aeruginosa]|nr:acyl-CoA dehydrogenase [Pseudomonas aeruginosa]